MDGIGIIFWTTTWFHYALLDLITITHKSEDSRERDQDTLNGLTLGNRFEGQDSAGAFTTGAALLSINSDAATKAFWVNSSYFPPLSSDTLRAGGYTGFISKFNPISPTGISHYTTPSSCVFANKPSKGGGILEECCVDEIPLDEPEEIINNSRSRSAYEDIIEEASSLTEPEQAFSDSISTTNAGALTEVEQIIKAADKKLLEGDNAEYLAKLADAESRNSDVSNSTVFEENEKILNSILIDKKYGSIAEFTESERNIIENIALQCPYKGGKAVFKARPLVYTWNRDIKFDDNLLCEGSASFRKATVKKNSNISQNKFFQIYPNPASDELFIKYNFSAFASASILIKDVLGRTVLSQDLNCKRDFLKFNVVNLETSIYIVEIIMDGRVLEQTKLSIIK